ncbi:MAG: nuclear transport factor 2 family protein [Acidobacteria bacterium]|nr:nuclear transport factor 2 family protein [Acidobacteriota bacterium]
MSRRSAAIRRLGVCAALAGALGPLVSSHPAAQDLRELQDRLEIAEQLAQYSYRWDSKDSEGFAKLFTADGAMDQHRGGEPISGARVVGHDAILDYARTSHQGRLADRQTRHHFSALVFLELTPDHAVTENMALITHQTADDTAAFISASGIYRNTWKKTAEGWRIAERVLSTDRFAGR